MKSEILLHVVSTPTLMVCEKHYVVISATLKNIEVLTAV